MAVASSSGSTARAASDRSRFPGLARTAGGTAMVKGAGIAVAQKFLRHSDVRLTIHTYGHLDVEDVRAGMTKAFATAQPELTTAPPLRNRPEDASAPSPEQETTADKRAQHPESASESRSGVLRTHARTAHCAAWARTRCS